MRSERLRQHQEYQQEPNTNASAKYKADGVDSVVAVTVTTSSATTTNTTKISTAVDNLNVQKDTQNDATHRQTSTCNDDEAINNVNDNIITISAISINDYSLHPERHEELTQIPERNGHQHPLKKLFKLNKKAAGKSSSSRAAFNNNNTTTSEQKITSIWKFSYWISFQDNIADVYHRKGRRLNGLQLPLHPLQLFGWLVLCVFGFAAYSLLIPLFKDELHGPLYGLVTGLYIIHIVSHLAALLIDPADRELRRLHQNNRIVPEFDRAKHAHVIENGRCHLCNIGTSSPQTKHCSVCNKCVGKFDHHCKWLNHCIGSRNYVAFLMCVVSAVCATLVILAAVIAQLALYFTKPDWLSLWFDDNVGSPEVIELFSRSVGNDSTVTLYIVTNDNFTEYVQSNVSTFGFGVDEIEDNSFLKFNSTTKNIVEHTTYLLNEMVNDTLQANDTINSALPPTIETMQNKGSHIENVIEENTTLNNSPNVSISGVALGNKIFLILIGCLGLLAAITAGLLLHLCFFHIYISFLGLTTYEYIRNHRQTQEANKAKYHAKDTQQIGDISNDDMSANNNPSKKTNTCAEIYFCSGVRHPKDVVLSTSRNGNETGLHSASNTHLKLHCCANSREYHQTAFKSYYMCSLLEETAIKSPLQIAYISADNATEFTQNLSTVEENSDEHVKTYHCCSTFAANTNKRRLNAAASKATLVDEVPEKSYLQYTEQCTLCTLRLPSPMIGKKLGRKYSTVATNNSKINHRNLPRTAPCTSQKSNAVNQRCCMKSISKQQRWRRKWNCCTGVPDSPDVPNDLITALNIKHQREMASDQKNKATEIPVHFITTISPNDETVGHNSRVHTNSPVLDTAHTKIPHNTAHHHTRTWPGTRLRNIMRIFNPYRRPRCRHQNFANCSLGDNLKQNQIRPFPLQLEVVQNGCHHHHFDVCKGGTYYDSSSPQPASSTTTVSEASSEHSNFSDSSNLNTPTSKTLTTFKTSVLPTSIIRDDIAVTYTTPIGLILPPALPPPARRKIPNPTDLDELAETLGFPSHPSNNNNFLHSAQRLPALNSLYRRQRRKHFLRTRSPTLSPIHESGLSNPTSPQPCRHTVNSCTASPQVINKFCSMGSSESARKTSSNCSLHSNTSSSSSSN